MDFKLFVNRCNVKTTVTVADDRIEFCRSGEEKETIFINDIIAIGDGGLEKNDPARISASVHYIQKSSNPIWRKDTVQLCGEREECEKFSRAVQNNLNEEIRIHRPKKLFVIINPIGGMKQAEKIFAENVCPLFELAGIQTECVVSQHHKHVEEIVATRDFGQYDGIVLCGGDGTYQQVINALLKRTQMEAKIDYNNPQLPLKPFQIPIGVIPTGSGNAIAQIAHGYLDVETSVLHIIRGRIYSFDVTAVYSDGKWIGCAGFGVAYGWWAELFSYMEKHRWLKANRYKYVPVYYFLFKDRHIFDVVMEVTLRNEHQGPNSNDEQTMNQRGKTEIIEGQFCNISLFIGDTLTEDRAFGLKNVEYGSSTLLLYKECSRREFLNHHKILVFVRDSDMFQKDYILHRKALGFSIKIKSTSQGNRLFSRIAKVPQRLLLDGEMFDLPSQDWEARSLGQIIPVFSSLEKLGTLKL